MLGNGMEGWVGGWRNDGRMVRIQKTQPFFRDHTSRRTIFKLRSHNCKPRAFSTPAVSTLSVLFAKD